MPAATIKFIISSSDSESKYSAENLLKGPNKRTKWKGKAGAEQNVVVLQLEREDKLTSIDVGNEFSALIEILVARSSEKEQLFNTIVPSTSFMSPIECRSEKNGNRVRIFTELDMVAAVAKQKWDVVKIICSQPFNRNLPYGLSFVNFVVDGEKVEKQSRGTLPKIPLRLKKTKNDSRFSLNAGAMFKQKEFFTTSEKPNITNGLTIKNEPAVTHVKAQKNTVEAKAGSKKTSVSPLRKKLLKKGDVSEGNDTALTSYEPKASNSLSYSSTIRVDAKRRFDIAVKCTEEKEPTVSFDKLLKGVKICVSGYENPLRSLLREKAMEMGADYETHWTSDCTHLVCAFPNTPKWRQVGSKGFIVTGKWIEKCYSLKKRLPEDKFACK